MIQFWVFSFAFYFWGCEGCGWSGWSIFAVRCKIFSVIFGWVEERVWLQAGVRLVWDFPYCRNIYRLVAFYFIQSWGWFCSWSWGGECCTSFLWFWFAFFWWPTGSLSWSTRWWLPFSSAPGWRAWIWTGLTRWVGEMFFWGGEVGRWWLSLRRICAGIWIIVGEWGGSSWLDAWIYYPVPGGKALFLFLKLPVVPNKLSYCCHLLCYKLIIKSWLLLLLDLVKVLYPSVVLDSYEKFVEDYKNCYF